jgi:hypothetical protein
MGLSNYHSEWNAPWSKSSWEWQRIYLIPLHHCEEQGTKRRGNLLDSNKNMTLLLDIIETLQDQLLKLQIFCSREIKSLTQKMKQ